MKNSIKSTKKSSYVQSVLLKSLLYSCIVPLGLFLLILAGETFIWLVSSIIGFIACFIISFILLRVKFLEKNNVQQQITDSFNEEQLIYRQFNITRTTLYRYDFLDEENNLKRMIYIVDAPQKCVFIIRNHSLTKIPFDEIINCKIYENSEVIGGFDGALIGGLIAGAAGAIIGAASASNTIQSYIISIMRSNLSIPQTNLILIDSPTPPQSEKALAAIDFSKKVHASICAIVAKNKNSK